MHLVPRGRSRFPDQLGPLVGRGPRARRGGPLAVGRPSPNRQDLTRIEGKRLDYAANGLVHHVEIDLTAASPTLARFDFRHGAQAVERVPIGSVLAAEAPFPYDLDLRTFRLTAP